MLCTTPYRLVYIPQFLFGYSLNYLFISVYFFLNEKELEEEKTDKKQKEKKK